METNFEILNFLNMVSPHLGKLYKQGKLGRSLELTEVSDQYLLSRINLDKISNEKKYPAFLFDENKKIKKKLKNSLKINKKLIKIGFFDNFLNKNENFEIGFYLTVRKILLEKFLKDYSGAKFDPFKIYDELYSLNPVLEELMFDSFENMADMSEFLTSLPTRYENLYKTKLKLINKKSAKRSKRIEKEFVENTIINRPIKLAKIKKAENLAKNVAKTDNKAVEDTKIVYKEKS